MNSTGKLLPIPTDVVDALFVHALRGYVAQAVPSHDAWKHIEEDVRGFPAQDTFALSHLSQAPYPLSTEIQQGL